MLTGYVPKWVSGLIAVFIVGSSLCSTAGAASTVSEAITLKNISPEAVMRGLGILSIDAKEADQLKVWSADDKAQQPPENVRQIALKGIDKVVPRTRDNALIIYGQRSAVDNFKEMIAVMDVPQKKIEIKPEVYRLNTKLAEIDPDINQSLKIGYIDKDFAGKLKAGLNESQAVLINSPVITAYQNVAGKVDISYEQMTSKLFFVPRINGDGSITFMSSGR